MFKFKSKPKAPPTVPIDKVIPLHYWDDTPFSRSVVLYYLMRIDDALDAQKLEAALVKLLNRDDWRKLGARLRLNDKGKLEYHVPSQFDEQRPPISYYHESYQMGIADHPLASRIPKPSTSPQIVGRSEDFLTFMRRPEDPRCLKDYIYTDHPMLGLHVVSFTDATLITLSWIHVLLDAMGRKALLDAWSLMLQGRDDQVLALYGVETDPLATLGSRPVEPYRHSCRQLGTWQMMIFGLRYAFDQIFWRPRHESRIICVPAAYMQLLRNTALNDISSIERDRSDTPPFVSEGDVLCAWWTRHILSGISKDPNQTIAINMAFGLRGLLAQEGVLPAGSAYVSNAVTNVPAFMMARDVLTKSLGYVAAALRKALVELGTKEQIEARMSLDRISQDRTGNGGLYGDPWMHMVVSSNWSKAQLYEADFSAAVVKEGRHVAGQKAGRPSYIQFHAFAKGCSLINGFSVTGKDAEGNYWLQPVMRKEYWLKIEKALGEKP
ncbi:MAG: hypothetical protein Q9191_000158 [Dirinaria sp. TL-2023a]